MHDLVPLLLKDILPTYGQRIKVYRAIKTAIDMMHYNEVNNHISIQCFYCLFGLA